MILFTIGVGIGVGTLSAIAYKFYRRHFYPSIGNPTNDPDKRVIP